MDQNIFVKSTAYFDKKLRKVEFFNFISKNFNDRDLKYRNNNAAFDELYFFQAFSFQTKIIIQSIYQPVKSSLVTLGGVAFKVQVNEQEFIIYSELVRMKESR